MGKTPETQTEFMHELSQIINSPRRRIAALETARETLLGVYASMGVDPESLERVRHDIYDAAHTKLSAGTILVTAHELSGDGRLNRTQLSKK